MLGDETLSNILRASTAVELFLNADSYAQHKQINIAACHPDASLTADSFRCLTLTDKANKIYNECKDLKRAIEIEARETCKVGNWSSFVHLMAISGLLKRNIWSVYPESNKGIRPLFHSQITQPLADCTKDLYIMWSRDGNLDNRDGYAFEPNHFVPLMPMHERKKVDFNESDDELLLSLSDEILNLEILPTSKQDKYEKSNMEGLELSTEMEDQHISVNPGMKYEVKSLQEVVTEHAKSADEKVTNKEKLTNKDAAKQNKKAEHEQEEVSKLDNSPGGDVTKQDKSKDPDTETEISSVQDKKMCDLSQQNHKNENVKQRTSFVEPRHDNFMKVEMEQNTPKENHNEDNAQIMQGNSNTGNVSEKKDYSIQDKPLKHEINKQTSTHRKTSHGLRKLSGRQIIKRRCISCNHDTSRIIKKKYFQMKKRKTHDDSDVYTTSDELPLSELKKTFGIKRRRRMCYLNLKAKTQECPTTKNPDSQKTSCGVVQSETKTIARDEEIPDNGGTTSSKVPNIDHEEDHQIISKKENIQDKMLDQEHMDNGEKQPKSEDHKVILTDNNLSVKYKDTTNTCNEVNASSKLPNNIEKATAVIPDIHEASVTESRKTDYQSSIKGISIANKEESNRKHKVDTERTTYNSITGQSDIKKRKLQTDAPKTGLSKTGKGKQELNFLRQKKITENNTKQTGRNKKIKPASLQKLNEPVTDESDSALSDDESGGESDVEIEMLFSSDDSSVSSDEESDNDIHEEDSSFSWLTRLQRKKAKPFLGPTPGPKKQLGKECTPLDYFFQIFPESIFEQMCCSSNAYVPIYEASKRKKNPIWTDKFYRPVTKDVLKAYFGIRMIMAVDPKPSFDDYWSKNPSLKNYRISATMSRERFKNIQRYFHINDPVNDPSRRNDKNSTEQVKRDPLYKASPLMEQVRKNSNRLYNLHQHISVDEAMIKCHGQHWCIVGAPNKPAKRGFKVFVLADAVSGYLSDFMVYIRRQKEAGLTQRVVETLTEPIYDRNHIIFVDKFYTSVSLALSLYKRETFICGSFNTGRHNWPTDLKVSKTKKKKEDKVRCLNRGEYLTRQTKDGKMVATVWKDKKHVYNLNTYYDPFPNQREDKVKRRHRDEEGKWKNMEFACPRPIVEFNKYMGGVDRHDHLRSSYSLQRTSTRWWTYFCWFAVDMAIINSYLLYKKAQPKATHKNFQLQV